MTVLSLRGMQLGIPTMRIASVSSTPPTVTISSAEPNPTAATPFTVTFTLSADSADFTLGSITVGNGTAGNLSGSGSLYTADITPAAGGTVTVDVLADAFHSGGAGNLAAEQFSITFYEVKVNDAFTGTNGTNLTAHAIAPTNVPGTAWTNIFTTSGRVITISSNRAVSQTFGTDSHYALEVGESDVILSTILRLPAATTVQYIYLRLDNLTDITAIRNCWAVAFGNGTIQLYERTGSTPGTVRQSASLTTNNAQDYTIRCHCVGSTITVYVDGVLTLTHTGATSHQTSTKFGLGLVGSASVAAQADDFKVFFMADYLDALKRTVAPIAYYPMVEASGNPGDNSGNEFDATYSGNVTYQNLTIPSGDKIPYFDGTAQANFWSAGFRDAFNGNCGTIFAALKVDADAWTDDTMRVLIQVRGNNNLINIQKSSKPYAMTAFRSAGGSTQQGYFYPSGTGDTMLLAITWNTATNQFLLYADGALSEALTAPGAWSELPASAYTHIGRGSSVSSDQWIGNVGLIAISDQFLSAEDYAALFAQQYPTTQSLFVVGDSKATGHVGAWRGLVLQGIEDATGVRTILSPTGFAIGGHDVGEMKATIDSNLAQQTSTPPLAILVNLGANDAVEPTPEASFIADYISVLDSLRAKYPNVPIGLVKPYRGDYAANCDLLAGYIDTVIANYPSGVTLAHDERGWFKDNIATYSADNVHYAGAAAMEACAAQWMAWLTTVLGL